MRKLTIFGAGPRIGRIVLPYLAITIILTIFIPSVFTLPLTIQPVMRIAGVVILLTGLLLYGLTARSLLIGIWETRLITTGLYKYSQNPIYAMIILLILPGIGLLMNSWIILTASVLGYIVFKRYISKEYNELTEIFGDEYLEYKKRTPEFFPFCHPAGRQGKKGKPANL